MEEKYPEYKEFYIESENTVPYNKLVISETKCIWWCPQKQHKIYASPYHYAKVDGKKRCFECSSLKSLYPNVYKQLDIEKNMAEDIDCEKLTFGTNKLVWWKCMHNSDHPSWTYPVHEKTSGRGLCKVCNFSMSYIEKEMMNILEKLKINHEGQKSFPGLVHTRMLHCDFYIPPDIICKNAIIIEVDGAQHFGISGYYEPDIKIRDRKKNIYAKQNQIHLLRVDYTVFRKYEQYLKEFIKIVRSTSNEFVYKFYGRNYKREYLNLAFTESND